MTRLPPSITRPTTPFPTTALVGSPGRGGGGWGGVPGASRPVGTPPASLSGASRTMTICFHRRTRRATPCPPTQQAPPPAGPRSEEHTSELQVTNAHLVCRLLLEKKKTQNNY